MGLKTLELTIISAKDLKDVNLIGKMDPYVVVYLSDNPNAKQKTKVHQDGGTNPSWNYTVRFTVDKATASSPGKYLIFKIKHEQTFGADKELGEVLVSIKELFDGVRGRESGAVQNLTYQVRRPSGKAHGELKISCKIIDQGQGHGQGHGYGYDYGKSSCSSAAAPGYSAAPHAGYPPSGSAYPPATGYPAPAAAQSYPPPASGHAQPYPPPASGPSQPYPPPASGPAQAYPPPASGAQSYPPPGSGPAQAYPPAKGQEPPTAVPYAAPPGPAQGYPPYGGYPPPPHGAGYGNPPPGGYAPPQGYPPAGYVPPQVVQQPQKPKKNKFGMGLGAGLIGGALGGLLLGEAVEGVYDAGYDAGYDGGFGDGGFDF